MAMTEDEVEAVVREVTDEEVEHYHEYGWVMLRELVDPNFADEMLRVFRAMGEAEGKEYPGNAQPARNLIEPFHSFMFSERCGKIVILSRFACCPPR